MVWVPINAGREEYLCVESAARLSVLHASRRALPNATTAARYQPICRGHNIASISATRIYHSGTAATPPKARPQVLDPRLPRVTTRCRPLHRIVTGPAITNHRLVRHTLVPRRLLATAFATFLLLGLAPAESVAVPLGPLEDTGQSVTSDPVLPNFPSLPTDLGPVRTRPAGSAAGLVLSPRPARPLHNSLAHTELASRRVSAMLLELPTQRNYMSLQDMSPPGRPALDLGESQAGKALWGSALGTVVTWTLGGILLAGADEVEAPPRDAGGSQTNPEGAALLLFAGGPPAGAIMNTGVEWGNGKAWVLGVLGGAVLGGAGAALGTAVGGSDRGETVGALVLGAPGATVGATVGVLLAAPDRRSALRYSAESGTWSAGLPAVQVRPGVAPGSDLAGKISLVTVDL
jgi:hypothetical protein